MLNPLSAYERAGMQAGKAARKHDIGLLNHYVIDELAKALVDMMLAVKVFHGPIAWEIYEQQSPEMRRARGALELSKQWTDKNDLHHPSLE